MDAVKNRNLCPVCGFALDAPAWNGGAPSDEICPSCGIQFGYDDAAAGDLDSRLELHEAWRQRWIAGGMQWEGSGRIPPEGWDPTSQLKRIGIDVTR